MTKHLAIPKKMTERQIRQMNRELDKANECYFDFGLNAIVHRFAPGHYVCKCGDKDCRPDPEDNKYGRRKFNNRKSKKSCTTKG